MSDKIKPHHLERKAILYIRQSSCIPGQPQPGKSEAAVCHARAFAAVGLARDRSCG